MQWTRARMVVVLVAMWLAVALAARADAASLFKCSDGEGRVSYQSAPCAPGTTQVWERTLAPDARLAPASGAASGREKIDPRTPGAEPPRTVANPPRQVRAAPRASLARAG